MTEARFVLVAIAKGGAFLDSSVHCMVAVSREGHFDTDLATQVVAAASALLSQLTEQRLSVRDVRNITGSASFFTKELVFVVDALCDPLRRVHASASEHAI